MEAAGAGTLLLALQQRQVFSIIIDVSLAEPPRTYSSTGRFLCDDALYACPEEATGKTVLDCTC